MTIKYRILFQNLQRLKLLENELMILPKRGYYIVIRKSRIIITVY